MEIEGLILAGGLSSRMGKHKMLMRVHQMTVIEKTMLSMMPFCSRVTVVTGYGAQDVVDATAHLSQVSYVHNPHFQQGMFSSFRVGLQSLSSTWFFMMPADLPFVHQDTFSNLMVTARNNGYEQSKIWIPSYRYQGGHPILLHKNPQLCERVALFSDDSTIKEVLSCYERVYVNVDDPGILMDLDTPEDYRKYVKE